MPKFPSAARKPPRRRLTHSVRAGIARIGSHRRTQLASQREAEMHSAKAGKSLRIIDGTQRILRDLGPTLVKPADNAALKTALITEGKNFNARAKATMVNRDAAKRAAWRARNLAVHLNQKTMHNNPRKTVRGATKRRAAKLLLEE